MFRTRLRIMVLVAAGLALSGAAHAADEVASAGDAKKLKADPSGFLGKYWVPRMDSRLSGEIQAATFYTNPAANPWTRDDATVSRVGRSAIRATTRALKSYAIERIGVSSWSLPLVRRSGTGLDALRTGSGGPRLFFGISHLAPRAEVLIPVNDGRVAFSADATGRMGAWFEASSSSLRVGASIDPRAHSGTFSLSARF